MSTPASPLAPMLRCAHCGASIVTPQAGLYSWLPPTTPRNAGYREMRAVHRSCMAAYEAKQRTAIPWLPLERLWPTGCADATR